MKRLAIASLVGVVTTTLAFSSAAQGRNDQRASGRASTPRGAKISRQATSAEIRWARSKGNPAPPNDQ